MNIVGQIEALYRYPVKSMAGGRLESAELTWHGIDGDRRLGLRKVDDRASFPWLTASKFPELVLYTPVGGPGGPTDVRTPTGKVLPIFGNDLAAEVTRRSGAPVEMMAMKHGIFDEATISLIASDTMREIGRLAGRDLDERRFRANIVVRLARPGIFQEDEWVGGTLTFGDGDHAPSVNVTLRDVRCSMVNLDPDSAVAAPEVLKAIVGAHENTAGVYATVVRAGQLTVGQNITLCPRGSPSPSGC